MTTKDISCHVAVEGQLLHCPAKIILGRQDQELVFGGTIQWSGRPLHDTVKEAGSGLAGQVSKYMEDLLPACAPGELSVLHQKDTTVIGLQEDGLFFKMAFGSGHTAVLFAFSMVDHGEGNPDTSVLIEALKKAAGFFGIQEFFFYAQSGDSWLLPILKPGETSSAELPQGVPSSQLLIYAHPVMIGNPVIQSENLCLMVQLGAKVSFHLKGDFTFTFLPAMRFRVDCGIGTQSFEITALAHVEKPVSLFGPFSMGDTCLMIQMSDRLTFGLYTSLYIRKLQLFGAVILSIQGGAVAPELLSAAVSDLSIPILVDNLLGEHIGGLEALDFLKILGLPFQNMNPFSQDILAEKNVPALVGAFNEQVKEPALRLDADQVQLTPFEDGMDVTDLKRMRHYYISSSGNLQLMAQFYYSSVNTRFGSFTVERGFFICGVLELWGKRFEVLFSLRESEGITAYAKIPEMNLGFLKIGPSQMEKSGDALPIAKDSILSQFLNPQQRGLVFFLEAGKNNISFYFDGNVELLKLFRADARIIFFSGLISIDLRTEWLSVLQVSLHLQVNYSDFRSGRFEFCLVIDTSKLTEKLTAVTEKIDQAIGKLRDKINNANREIERARAHVNELYGQIAFLDLRIEDCRYAIKHTKWWKRAFVAIAKGIEIGAYEVAKAGVYAAIGVANAALNVAKGIVSLGGKIGESVLRAVNGVIKGAMSLFYLHFIKLAAKADVKEQYFLADMEFVALGKTFRLKKQIGIKALESSPEGALSDSINDTLQPDLENIEEGAFRSNWRKYRYEQEPLAKHGRRMEGAKQYMASSVRLMQSMQKAYVDEFQTPMEEFDEMNVSLMDAMGHVENILSAGVQAGNVKQLAQSMGGLKRSVAARGKKGIYRDEELRQTKELIAEYEEARMLYDNVAESLKEVQKHQRSLQNHFESIKKNTQQTGEVVVNGTEGDVGRLLGRVEEQMYDAFPVDRSGSDFINPSREPMIQQCFIQAEREQGGEPSEKIRHMRNRSRKGNYNSRL